MHRESQLFDLARDIQNVINADKGRFDNHITLTAAHYIPAKSDCTRAIMFLQGFDGIDTARSKGLHTLSKQMGDDEDSSVRNGIGCPRHFHHSQYRPDNAPTAEKEEKTSSCLRDNLTVRSFKAWTFPTAERLDNRSNLPDRHPNQQKSHQNLPDLLRQHGKEFWFACPSYRFARQ